MLDSTKWWMDLNRLWVEENAVQIKYIIGSKSDDRYCQLIKGEVSTIA